MGSQQRKVPHITIDVSIPSTQTLGQYKEPAGHQREQFQQLQVKSNRIHRIFMEVPVISLRTLNVLFHVLSTECNLPTIGFIYDAPTVGADPAQGYVHHCAPMRIQPKHKK
jgi:hypothetical protein